MFSELQNPFGTIFRPFYSFFSNFTGLEQGHFLEKVFPIGTFSYVETHAMLPFQEYLKFLSLICSLSATGPISGTQ